MPRFLVGIGTGVLQVRAVVGGALTALLKLRNNDQIVLRSADRVTIR
jgi:hypothetical protein